MVPSLIEIMVESVCIQVSNAVSFSDKKSPRALCPAIVLPPLRVQNVLRSLKVQALACVAKDAMNFCLAKQKLEVWGK